MLRCKDVADQAGALIDGELGLLGKLKLRLHLAMCAACRRFETQMLITRDVSRVILTSPPADAGTSEAEELESVLSRFHELKQGRRR